MPLLRNVLLTPGGLAMRSVALSVLLVFAACTLSWSADTDITAYTAKFSVSCVMSLESGTTPDVPVDVLNTLANESSMRSVQFQSGGAGSRMQVEFVFSDLPSFTAWHQSDAGREILETLQDASVEALELKLEAKAAH